MAITKIDSSMLEDVSGADNLVKLDANAKIPAGTGANLLNKPGPLTSASDPAIDSNKALGTEWLNTTSGEMYICTDATAGANVWTNVGAGSGDVQPYFFTRCTTAAFIAGGYNNSANRASIDRISFTADGNATDHGDLTVAKRGTSGTSSITHGYNHGGRSQSTDMETFAMASSANATDVGDMPYGRNTGTGVPSDAHGWIHGGTISSAPTRNCIKHAFATGTDAGTNVGDIVPDGRDYPQGGSSSTHGYSCGGVAAGTNSEGIHKWSFASETPSADVGDLLHSGIPSANCTTDGYVWLAGTHVAPEVTRIDRMSTASDSNAVASGSSLLTSISQLANGSSSTTYGYISGGYPPYYKDTIEKWSVSSAGTATDVGNLTAILGETNCNAQL